MDELHIRRAEAADLAAIASIETACFAPMRRSSRRALRHSLRSPVQSVWIAQHGEGPDAGVVAAAVLHHHARSFRIYSIAVRPEFQGRGIGGRLMRAILDLARRHGCEAVTLECDQGNVALVQWYERMGFVSGRVIRAYYGPGDHGLRMRLALAPKGAPGAAPRPLGALASTRSL